MTDKELLYIRTVAEERSVSKAAQKLFITQPSLSQCIQRIESALGTRLFTRTSSGLILTYAGERYCQIAGEILRMPGLPKEPQALHIDIVNGEIEGLS